MLQITINTTQNVKINFLAASIGERLLAFMADLTIQIAYLIAVFWGIFVGLGLGNAIEALDSWSKGAISLFFMLPILLYTLLFESIFEGQTLGKKLLKIKVVKIDGYQASLGDYLIRWLFRLIEIFSNGGVISMVCIVISQKSQRLGDIVAGTAVISMKQKISINSTILEEIDANYVPIYPSVIKLSDNDIRIIKDTFLEARSKQDYKKIALLTQKIESVTAIKNQSGNDVDFVKTVLKDYNFYTQTMI